MKWKAYDPPVIKEDGGENLTSNDASDKVCCSDDRSCNDSSKNYKNT